MSEIPFYFTSLVIDIMRVEVLQDEKHHIMRDV